MEDLEQYRKYIDIEKLKELKQKDDQEKEQLKKQDKIYLDAPIGLNPKMMEWEKQDTEMSKNISKMSPEAKQEYYYYKRWNVIWGFPIEEWRKTRFCNEEYDKRDVVKTLSSEKWVKDQIENNPEYENYRNKEKLNKVNERIKKEETELERLESIINKKRKDTPLKYNLT